MRVFIYIVVGLAILKLYLDLRYHLWLLGHISDQLLRIAKAIENLKREAEK